MHRIAPIEGLRAYLALWVWFAHVLMFSGCNNHTGSLLGMLTDGSRAVEIFIILSGFVIFLLLDEKRETYGKFIFRRLFRIYPLYIVLLLVSIFCGAQILEVNFHMRPALPDIVLKMFWLPEQHFSWNVFLHLLLLQGLPPESALPYGSVAFLPPAWSLSVEWQFYLLAPLAFAGVVKKGGWQKAAVFAICVILFFVNRNHLVPLSGMGAALPCQIQYFFVGALSYFIYQKIEAYPGPANSFFPWALVLGLFFNIFQPMSLWFLFLALLCEGRESLFSRLLLPLFNNPVAQYLGRISYSIYLSHFLILYFTEYVIIAWLPPMDRKVTCAVMAAISLPLVLLVSSLTYHLIEAPGIKLGHYLVRRWSARRRAQLVAALSHAV